LFKTAIIRLCVPFHPRRTFEGQNPSEAGAAIIKALVRISCRRRQTDMHMKKKYIMALAWMMGLFVSPEALFLQGNIAGISGFGFVFPLAAGLILHWFNAIGTIPPKGTGATPSGEIQLLEDIWGSFAASWILLMARPVVAVCLATAVLVTSGFVFNEVFLYWFPNFGFAALLLAVLLTVNLVGPQAAAIAQVAFTSTAIIGLACISIVGLFTWQHIPEASHAVLPGTSSPSITLVLIAFVGYDMLRYTDHKLDHIQLFSVIKVGLIASLVLFTLWNIASLLFVAPARLMATSIPHILAAKAILGPTGRMVIGVIAIAGACAAVNYLYQTVSRVIARMARHHLLPGFFKRSATRPLFALFTLAATTGLLMTMGFAGSDLLDISLHAGLILWLVFYTLIHLAFLLQGKRNRRKEYPGSVAKLRIRHSFVMLSIVVIVTILVATHSDPITLLKAILTILALTAGFAGGGLFIARGFAINPTIQSAKIKKGVKP
jgi:amino acid transporter